MRYMTIFVACMAAIVSSALMTPAFAQSSAPTGSRLNQSGEEVDTDDVRVIQRRFAKCVYLRRRDKADELLAASDFLFIDSMAAKKAENWLFTESSERCLGRSTYARQRKVLMTINVQVMRNLLTEAAYLVTNDAAPAIDRHDPEILIARYFVNTPTTDQARLIAGFADCIVYRAPVQADKLVRTRPGSDEENAALVALTPHLGGCLQAGSDIRLTPASLRTIVADGLWARSHYAAQSGASE